MGDVAVQTNLLATTDAALAEIAAELRMIDHRSGWSRTLAIGELILKRFFNGSIKEWRTRRCDKEESIRRLAHRSDCPLGRSALSAAVAVYVAARDIPGGKIRDELTPSHLAVALKVEPSRRIELLQQAIACQWTVRELRSQVYILRKSRGERRGRPRSSPARAALTQAANAGRMLERAQALLRSANCVEPELLRNLQRTLAQLEERAAAARARLAEVSGGPRITLAPALSKGKTELDEPKTAVG